MFDRIHYCWFEIWSRLNKIKLNEAFLGVKKEEKEERDMRKWGQPSVDIMNVFSPFFQVN